MKNNIRLKIIFAIFASSILFSCAPKNNNIDFDFTTLKKSNKVKLSSKNDKENKKIDNFENKLFIKDLVPLKEIDHVLSATELGKKDPFSDGVLQQNILSSDFKLTGFLNTEIKNYALVTYLNNEGTITESSIGGLNTNLLPNGAKVIRIDPKKKILIINFDNENLIFEF